MDTIIKSSKGVRLLLRLNWDRLYYALTIMFALVAGSWIGNL